MQQLDSSVLATHFDSLLRAVVKAIDNPFGSLSTTFEAIQALMKLGTQLSQKMKESSCMWAPAMYRRLLSSDKREKEMCQRCLLRIKPVMLPPSLTLSKVMVRDLKSTLLTGLMELLKKGKKLQALQAWGWFIRLVGSLALKNKNLVNEMLKVPQQTFADQDSQVQIASLIAWEGLTDALIYLPSAISDVTNPRICRAQKEVSATSSQFNGSEVERLAFLKSLKLIMTPLTGIMSSKCDIAVKSSCFNTWCYLLQKLASFVNDPDVVIQVLEPILTAVFRGGPESRNIWFWNFCVSILDDFIEVKNENNNGESSGPTLSDLLSEKSAVKPHMSERTLQKHYSIKWLPWDCCHLEFVLRMIDIIITGVMTASVPVESKVLAYATTARTFRSFLKGAQSRFKKCSSDHDTITKFLSMILISAKNICEDASSKNDCDDELVVTCLQLVKSVAEELDPCIVDSSLYMVPLELKVVTGTQLRLPKMLAVSSIGFTDKIKPAIYLTLIYVTVVVQATSKATCVEPIIWELSAYFKFALSSYDAVEIAQAIVGVLYCNGSNSSCWRVWVATLQGLQEYLDHSSELMPLKVGSAAGNLALIHLLAYPLVFCSSEMVAVMEKVSECSKAFSSLTFKPEIGQVTKMWKPLYIYINSLQQMVLSEPSKFSADLCACLNGLIADTYGCASEFCKGKRVHDVSFLPLCAEVAECILENLQIEKTTPERSEFDCRQSTGIDNCVLYSASILKLSWANDGETPAPDSTFLRLLPSVTRLVARLQLKEDIVSFLKVIYCPLATWVSDRRMNRCTHLESLWTETLRSLQRSQPPIAFNSSFLELIAPLLEKTLNHTMPSISLPTIAFWKSSYGNQTDIDIPPCLLPALDKLSRQQQINVDKTRSPVLKKHDARIESMNFNLWYKVTTKLNSSSKRVELLQDDMRGAEELPCQKRRMLDLAEHQKEVRRAQQGREQDSGGHGPGIRTYTGADFSQWNDDSQARQDIQNPELILDLLRRAG